MDYRAVLFDFDGVLCRDRFYENALLPGYREVYAWIQANIFGNKGLTEKWMKGQISSDEINRLIAERTGIEYGKLSILYEKSIRGMRLEKEILELARALRSSGKKVGVVTDNMDVFTSITVPRHRLRALFDAIVNSSDYGILKNEHDGRLFGYALEALGVSIEESLMIDDSRPVIGLYKRKGGSGFLYSNIAELKDFLRI